MSVADQLPEGRRADGSGAMFDRIATRYDLLNRILSLGIDRGWRRRAVRAARLPECEAVLDLATGTADLAIELARSHDGVRVLGTDPSPEMLAVGRTKIPSGLEGRVELIEGDAQQIAAEDGAFGATTIAFGIRNVPDRLRALREMARVTRAGGRVVILELTEPPGGLLGWPARFWVHQVVPRIGALLSGDREYRYLQQSIAAFPDRDAFCAMMREAGLEVLQARPLTFGVAHLFVGTPATAPDPTTATGSSP